MSDPVAPSAIPATLIAAAEEGVGGSDVSEPKLEEIARLAYSYWEVRGGEGGSAEEDWLRAEQELRMQDARRRCVVHSARNVRPHG